MFVQFYTNFTQLKVMPLRTISLTLSVLQTWWPCKLLWWARPWIHSWYANEVHKLFKCIYL